MYIINFMTMNHRISLIIQAKNISPAQLADDIGVQRSGISHIINGRNKPSLDFIQRILKKYPDISMKWLMFGEGQMMNSFPAPVAVPENKIPEIQNSRLTTMELFADNTSPVEADELTNADDRSNETLPEESSNMNNTEFHDNREKVELESKNTIKNNREDKSFIHAEKEINLEKKKISRIVIFYTDKTFSEYFPEN